MTRQRALRLQAIGGAAVLGLLYGLRPFGLDYLWWPAVAFTAAVIATAVLETIVKPMRHDAVGSGRIFVLSVLASLAMLWFSLGAAGGGHGTPVPLWLLHPW